MTGGYTTNAGAEAGGWPASFGTIAPELLIKSDWARHEATLMLRGSYEHFFGESTPPDEPSASADATLRLDVANDWTADLAAGIGYKHEDITDPAFPAGGPTRRRALSTSLHRRRSMAISGAGLSPSR